MGGPSQNAAAQAVRVASRQNSRPPAKAPTFDVLHAAPSADQLVQQVARSSRVRCAFGRRSTLVATAARRLGTHYVTQKHQARFTGYIHTERGAFAVSKMRADLAT